MADKNTFPTFPIEHVIDYYPDAFAALPEPYQNDSCLEFYIDNSYLCAIPADGEEYILGDWIAYFDKKTQQWRDSASHQVVSE